MRVLKWIALAAFPLVSWTESNATAATTVTVDGDTIQAEVTTVVAQADVTIAFDNVIGLSANSIGITASTIDPTDISLLARLPAGMTIPQAFPIMITVEPPDTHGLSFTDTAMVEIHTHALSLVTNSPLRLMKAPLGGQFEDITESLASGSVRSRGRTGGFSQFVIAVETRSHSTVGQLKFAQLDLELDDSAIAASVQSQLQSHLDAAKLSFDAGNYVDAIDELEELIDLVEAESGTNIPNVWRASRDLNNVAGRIHARASTLIFTLRMANALLL